MIENEDDDLNIFLEIVKDICEENITNEDFLTGFISALSVVENNNIKLYKSNILNYVL